MTSAPAGLDREQFYWRVLALVGLCFTLLGLAQQWALLFPLHIGSGEWEFGTYSAFMDRMPLLMMGLGLLTAGAVGTGRLLGARLSGVVLLVVLLVILAGAFLYATNVPNALHTAPKSTFATGIKKAVAKAAVQTAIYPVACVWLAVSAFRAGPKK